MPDRILLSIQVGAPERVESGNGKTFRTSLYKNPVCEAIWLGEENLDGNQQADLRYHGGPDKAVCCFASEHYPIIAAFLGQETRHGAFGENFTCRGMLENEVCLGDKFSTGDAIIEVSQPRGPCNNLAKRWNNQKLPAFLVEHCYTGFYTRVVESGIVQPGEPMILLGRKYPEITIAHLNELMYSKKPDRAALEHVLTLPELSEAWRESFQKRLNNTSKSSS